MSTKAAKPLRATPIRATGKLIPAPASAAKGSKDPGPGKKATPTTPTRAPGKPVALNAKGRAMSDTGKNDGSTAESLDKVRDLLFGQQVRDQEKRFTRLEDRLSKELLDVRDDLAKRMAALESFAKAEIDALTDRLKGEQGERTKADRELAKSLEETGKSLEKKFNDLDSRTTESMRDIRKLILDQSKLLRDEMLKSHQELSAALQKSVGELRSDKVDRFALGDILTEVALRLKGEWKMPKGG